MILPDRDDGHELDPGRIREFEIQRFEHGGFAIACDDVAAEEPFEIRIGGRSAAIVMRTPGHDTSLAAGFLLSEGVIEKPDDIIAAQPGFDRDGFPERNVLELRLRDDLEIRALNRSRPFTVTSSCGLCGATSIDETCSRAFPIRDGLVATAGVLLGLDATMRRAQTVFSRTGGLHAAGLYTAAGELIVLREDVGRHNAVDKVVGAMFLQRRLPLSSAILLVSGRASFELVQKAAIAGIPILAAVSAPSSLAVEASRAMRITLVGLLRSGRFVVYSHPERIEGVE